MPWNDPDPKKDYARKQVKYAVKSGRLHKPKMCSSCGVDGLIHAHHDNYKKPLDVIWLCPQCHKDRHYWIQDVGIGLTRLMDEVSIMAISVAKELI